MFRPHDAPRSRPRSSLRRNHLLDQNDLARSVASFNQVVERFDGSLERPVREEVAYSMIDLGGRLTTLGRKIDAGTGELMTTLYAVSATRIARPTGTGGGGPHQ